MAAVAATRRHRAVIHGVGGKAGGRIGVAIAALDGPGGNVRGCGVPGRRRAVVAIDAIGICRRVDIGCAGPRDVAAAHRRGMTAHAVIAVGRDVAGIGHGAVGTFRAFPKIGAVVAGVAALGVHRGVVHGVGGKARGRIGVAVAALNRP